MAPSGSIFVLGSFVAACSVKVERFPGRGESARASSFTIEAGGKGFNLAVGARRLGAPVDGLIAAGEDVFGDLAARAIADAGLPDRMLIRRAGPSGAGVGFIDVDGETSLAVFPGANDSLSAEDVDGAAAALAEARLVLAQFEIGPEPIAAAFGRARSAGALTILNPSPYRAIPDEVLRHTRMMVVNQVEAAELAGALGLAVGADGDGAADLAARLFICGVETLVVTLGPGGAIAFTATGEALRQPAFGVEALDTLGCGDAFTAGLAHALWAGLELAEGLRRAAACGAFTARRRGVLAALPTRAGLEALLAEGETPPRALSRHTPS